MFVHDNRSQIGDLALWAIACGAGAVVGFLIYPPTPAVRKERVGVS
jgi:hypothetical protein